MQYRFDRLFSSKLYQLSLDYDECVSLAESLIRGEFGEIQSAAILTALQFYEPSVDLLYAIAGTMRGLALPLEVRDSDDLIDLCGTGGDSKNTFNISTAASVVVAAGGGRVAKHGNRSVSSKCGSADVLEILGVDVSCPPHLSAKMLEELGIAFLFAPIYHPLMRNLAGVRRSLGFRTVFNLVGPLANPAGCKIQLMGVYSPDLLPIQIQTLKRLGSRRAMLVCGDNGLDEINLAGETKVSELKNGDISNYWLTPRDFGLEPVSISDIQVRNPEESKDMLLSVLQGERVPARSYVLANSAAAFYLLGLADNFLEGVNLSEGILDSGLAAKKLNQMISFHC